MSEEQINEWIVDFSQAKIAIHNLEVLVTALTQAQSEVVVKLKSLFEKYGEFIGDGASPKQKEKLAEQVRIFERIGSNMHMTTTKFAARANGQLDSSRTQVNFMYHTLGKLHSLKGPQYAEAAEKLGHQVPEFLNLFDAFLARFTLEIRWQQADFYKQLGDAFTHAGRPEPVKSVVQSWVTEYEQIMPAVEALKSVRPQPDHARRAGLSAPEAAGARHQPEKVDSVLLTPVKWIHSKFTRDLKDFRFSDPRRGFFNKPTHPPKSESEVVRAVFDFNGETESDLKFKKGDIITIVDKGTEDDPNWWCGEFNGERGLFPRNYVEEVSSEEAAHKELHPDEYVPRELAPNEKGDEKSDEKSDEKKEPTADKGEKSPKDANEPSGKPGADEEEHPPARPPRPSKSNPASPTSGLTSPTSPSGPASPTGPASPNLSGPSGTSGPAGLGIVADPAQAGDAGLSDLASPTGPASPTESTNPAVLAGVVGAEGAASAASAAGAASAAEHSSHADREVPSGLKSPTSPVTTSHISTESPKNPTDLESPADPTSPRSPTGLANPLSPTPASTSDPLGPMGRAEVSSEVPGATGAHGETGNDAENLGSTGSPRVPLTESPDELPTSLASEAKDPIQPAGTANEPGAAQPGVSESGAAEPRVTEPAAEQPSAAEYSAAPEITKTAEVSTGDEAKAAQAEKEAPSTLAEQTGLGGQVPAEPRSPKDALSSVGALGASEPVSSAPVDNSVEGSIPHHADESEGAKGPPLPARKSTRKILDDNEPKEPKETKSSEPQHSNEDPDDELL